MGRATREVGERNRGELRRAQRARHGELAVRGAHARRGAGSARQSRRFAHQQRCRNDQQPGESAQCQHRAAPAVIGDQPARERRYRHRADRETGRDEGHCKTAMPAEPACCRGGQRCIEAAGRHTDDHAEQDLELTDRAGLARRCEPEAEQCAAREHDRSRSEPVGERSPEERGRTHVQEIEQRRRRDARPRPAGRRRHRLQKDAERHHRAHPETGYDDARADDDPAVKDLHRTSQERVRNNMHGAAFSLCLLIGTLA